MKAIRHQSDRVLLGRTPREAHVQHLAEDRGWPRVQEIADDIDAGEAYQVVWAVAPDTTLSYIEDPVSHNCYAVVAGPGSASVSRVLEDITEALKPWDARTLFLSIDTETDPRERARAVIRVGLGAPDAFDERFFQCIRDAFSDPEKWVREAAVWSTAYSPWPQYRPLLQEAAQSDPEPKVREDAEIVLQGFDEAGSAAS